MVRNGDGLVALAHYNSNGAVVQMDADKTIYTFTPKYGISLAWVRPEHLDGLLKVQAKVCCGRHGNKFLLASIGQVSVWETGTRPTEEFLHQYSVT